MASCGLNPISPHTRSCEYCINNWEEAKDHAQPAQMCEDHNKPSADSVLRIVLRSPTPFPLTGRAAAKNIAMGWVIWFHFEKYTFLHALWEAHVSIFVGVVCYLGHNRTQRNSLCVNAREGFLMNWSVIEMERVSSLLNEGVTITASLSEQGVSSLVHWAIKKQRDHCPNTFDQESEDIHAEKSQANQCMEVEGGGSMSLFIPDSVLALQPEVLLTAQDSLPENRGFSMASGCAGSRPVTHHNTLSYSKEPISKNNWL